MQLTRGTDYAIRVLVHLAGLPPGSRASQDRLANATAVPSQFLGKILQTLARAGLIVSFRGAQGGFELARLPQDVTLLDVVEAMQGSLVQSLTRLNTREHEATRPAYDVWAAGLTAMRETLRSATLASLAVQAGSHRYNGAAPAESAFAMAN